MRNWERHERRVSYLLGGKRTKGSGSGTRKGDVWTSEWVVECKSTTKHVFRLARTVLEVLRREADRVQRGAVLVLEFPTAVWALVLEERVPVQAGWKSRTVRCDRLQEGETIDTDGCRWRWMPFERFLERDGGYDAQ